MAIAYLSNCFPEPLESYVWEEVAELRGRGAKVVVCSARRPLECPDELTVWLAETVYLQPLRIRRALTASWLLVTHFPAIADLIWHALRGPEPLPRRLRTIAHSWLGAYLAASLRDQAITHIHVHHGYFSSWAGMFAARLLGASFSVTLHGSDLLLRADYLDTKLKNCLFCVTVSSFNRRYLLERYAAIGRGKVMVHRLGVDVRFWTPKSRCQDQEFSILSVGRLHPVKNHGFLVLACRDLKTKGVKFRCVVVGDGKERPKLESLIHALDLSHEVQLIGAVPRRELRELYAAADVVVLTSRSEGIPVSLMEAMAMERIVLAPNITGIPELIIHARTGFLYQLNSTDEFVESLNYIRTHHKALAQVRHAARQHVESHFNRESNLGTFAIDFLDRVQAKGRETVRQELNYEDPLLQQIQLPVQRDRSLSV